MKSLIIVLFVMVTLGCRASGSTLQAHLEKHGDPVAVVSGFKKEEMKLRTVSLYGLDESALARLKAKDERVLVYSSDPRFAQAIEYHFEDLIDPAAHVGWTMFATLESGTTLELVRFDAAGHLLDQIRLVVDVAYLEEGTENHLVRIKPKSKVPIQSPQTTPVSAPR
ncbi:MAG TPA: hypothetical protein VGD88_03530 [Opitutaceae bacterium]